MDQRTFHSGQLIIDRRKCVHHRPADKNTCRLWIANDVKSMPDYQAPIKATFTLVQPGVFDSRCSMKSVSHAEWHLIGVFTSPPLSKPPLLIFYPYRTSLLAFHLRFLLSLIHNTIRIHGNILMI